jgi:hypothetical protein
MNSFPPRSSVSATSLNGLSAVGDRATLSASGDIRGTSGKYRLREVGRRQWEKLATELHLDAGVLLSRIHAMAVQIPDASSTLRRELRGQGLARNVLDRLATSLTARARECAAMLG